MALLPGQRDGHHVRCAEQRAGELVVEVIDSSHSGHGANDARNRGHASGLGAGALVLITGRDGEPVGYRWSTSRHSLAYRTEVAPGHLP
jgi:hypothetical protein